MATHHPSRKRRLRRVFTSGRLLAAEALERRAMLDGASGDAQDPRLVTLTWNGRTMEALRDSYIVQMPQTNTATARAAWDYQSAEPAVVTGWSHRSLGGGFFEVSTPGSSLEQVSAWAREIGAASVSPNGIFRPQAVSTSNRRVPNDTLFGSGRLWGLDNASDADIDAPEAWGVQAGSKDIIVAVMDSGTDYTHRDLQQNLWNREIANSRLPEGAQPIPKSKYGLFGWDSADGDHDVMPNQYTASPFYDQHGTEVAGIIGAKGNNGEGSVGVNWDVSIYTAKIFSDRDLVSDTYVQWATTAAFYDAVDRIIDLRTLHGQNIVAANMSFGHYGAIFDERWAINRLNAAGILVVAAAGNDDLQTDIGTSNLFFPADYELPTNVISVAASDREDKLTSFTNWGGHVDIAAPGVDIWSTIPTGNPPRPIGSPVGYRNTSVSMTSSATGGTSMAAPFVTGVAALVASEYRRRTGSLPSPDFLRKAILNGADVKPSLRTKIAGVEKFIAGDRRLNAYGAIKWCQDNLPPGVTVTADRMPGSSSTGQLEGDAGVTPSAGFTATLVDINGKVVAAESDIKVEYYTEDWEAIAGQDYVGILPGPTPRTFTIPRGSSTAKFTVDIIGDDVGEPNERFRVRLRVAAGSDSYVRTDMVVGTILDDDPDSRLPAVVLPQASLTLAGGAAGPRLVPVQLLAGGAAAADRAVIVSYAVVPLTGGADAAIPGIDFVAQTGRITIPAGKTEAAIPVRLLGNGLPGDRRFKVLLTNVTPGMLKQGKTECTLTMSTPAGPLLSVSSVPSPIVEGTGRNSRHFVGLSLDRASTAPVTVSYRFRSGVDPRTGVNYGRATAGADFIGGTGRITILPGSTTAQIPFTILGDRIDEVDETAFGAARDEERFTLEFDMSSLRGATLGASRIELRILDDDPTPPVTRSLVITPAAAAFASLESSRPVVQTTSTSRRRR